MALSKKGVGKCHQHMGYLNVSKNIENWIVYYLLWYIGSEAARPTHGGFLEIGYLKIKWFIIILWKDMLFNGHAPLSDTPILFFWALVCHIVITSGMLGVAVVVSILCKRTNRMTGEFSRNWPCSKKLKRKKQQNRLNVPFF